MKLQLQAFSLAVGLVTVLGIFTSVNSTTPSTDKNTSSVENSVQLNTPKDTEVEATEEPAAEMEAVDESLVDEASEDSAEITTPAQTCKTEESGVEAAGSDTELEAVDESAVNEASEDSEEIATPAQTCETEKSEIEATEQEAPELETSEVTIEADDQKVVLPENGTTETNKESEATGSTTPALEPAQ